MENIKSNSKGRSIIWTISLVGFPLLSITMPLMHGLVGSIDSNKFSYIVIMSSFFLWCLFSLVNIVFSFYTLYSFWKNFSSSAKAKYLLICIFTNILGAYVMGRLWNKKGINVYSFSGKNKFGFFSFIFYFLASVSVMLPIFIGQLNFQNAVIER